jgi:hypothetical protein
MVVEGTLELVGRKEEEGKTKGYGKELAVGGEMVGSSAVEVSKGNKHTFKRLRRTEKGGEMRFQLEKS